jgi:hypothetical protein
MPRHVLHNYLIHPMLLPLMQQERQATSRE